MNSLFLSFDPSTIFFSLNWLSLIFVTFLSISSFWQVNSRLKKLSNWGCYVIHEELKALSSSTNNGLTHFIMTIWILLVGVNLLGLLPYVFTCTSHMVFSFTFSFMVWCGPQFFFWFYSPNNAFAHLVPKNTPLFLIPLIVVIELISNIIRPLTLAIRLSANLMTGHLILTLLGSSIFSGTTFFVFLIFPMVIMLTLEFCVALIQAQVFSMLSMIYSEEALNHK